MTKKIILQDVDKKWNNYRKYIKPIIKNTFLITKNKKILKDFTIVLINDDTMYTMNKQYRQLDRSTDILTFVDDSQDDYLGDIFINVERVISQAQEYGHSIKREFCFLVVHGCLHLLGYDHHTLNEEKEMFSLQEEILKDIAKR